jgi:cytochrome c biogenesis protein CcdA
MAEPSAPSDLPARIAGLFDDLATRIRSLTVDRVANGVTWTAVGIVLATMAFLIVFWLLVAGFRALGTLIGQELAYAVVGGVLVIIGIVLWRLRFPKDGEVQE